MEKKKKKNLTVRVDDGDRGLLEELRGPLKTEDDSQTVRRLIRDAAAAHLPWGMSRPGEPDRDVSL